MPLNTTNETIDKSLEMPTHKLIIKVLVVYSIAMGFVIYFGANLLLDEMKMKDVKIEKLENKIEECESNRLNDLHKHYTRLEEIDKKL